MPVNKEKYFSILEELKQYSAVLVAVSKTKPVGDILALYELGQRDFGENYVNELVEKQQQLPADIRWHFIGHLQRNKVKFIVPFVHLIHGIDSYKLLVEVNNQAEKRNRVIDVLLQVHIAKEETKFGFDDQELEQLFKTDLSALNNIKVTGLMGMASFSDDQELIKTEFHSLENCLRSHAKFQTPNTKLQILSTGMSGDYKIALQEGSNMVRIGSLLFGAR